MLAKPAMRSTHGSKSVRRHGLHRHRVRKRRRLRRRWRMRFRLYSPGFLYLGEMLEFGTVRQVFAAARDPRTQRFITGRFG
jgi:hypothetical protein